MTILTLDTRIIQRTDNMSRTTRIWAALLLAGVIGRASASEWYVERGEPALFPRRGRGTFQQPATPKWDPSVVPVASRYMQPPSDPLQVAADMDYSDVCCEPEVCRPVCAHRCGVFGEFLYLRPRSAEVAYGVPIDGAIVPPVGVAPIQVGRIGIADPDYSSGYRVGITWALDDCSSVVAAFTSFASNTHDTMTAEAPLVIRAMALHPGTANAAADCLDASATYGVDFDLIDVDYRFVWLSDQLSAVNLLLGLRYGQLDQDFQAVYTQAGSTETMFTDISFDGAGLLFGIDAERHHCGTGLLAYGKANTSFMAGDFRARYFQGSAFDPVIVDTNWKAGRLVSTLDLELGAGWQSSKGCVRLTAGYLISSWFNTVKTDEFIQAVQTNNFVGLDDALTFDGFVARAEIRF